MKRQVATLLLSIGLALGGGEAWAQLPVQNPLSGTIPKTSWSVELQDVVTIPGSPGRLEFLTGGGAAGLAYVIDQEGPIYSFDPSVPSPSTQVFLDLDSAVPNFDVQSQTGVRGLAFHPDFNNPGTDGYRKFYTSHSREEGSTPIGSPTPAVFSSPGSTNNYSVVGEWEVLANGSVDTNSYRELMRIGQPFNDHNIGQIGFNPNATPGDPDYGNLYVALGDGGNIFPISQIDPFSTAQDPNTPHGSILRINPIASGGDPYTIPSASAGSTDNPFKVSDDPEVSRNLIWALGLRNPHRFTFDTAGDGKMLITDIGQANIEEVNLGAAGANYGWSDREGTFETTATVVSGDNIIDTLAAGHPTDTYTYPVAQYDHINNLLSGSSAIVGAAVYRGTAVPQLTGLYIFGEFASNSGPIFAVDVDDLVQQEDFTNLSSMNEGRLAPFQEIQLTQGGVEKTMLEIINDAISGSVSRTDLRFGVGPDDEIYVLNKHDGIVRKFVSVSGLLDGDADRDGDVDADDLQRWEAGYGSAGDWSDGDFDGDALVTGSDFLTWQRQAGKTAPLAAVQQVPEPSSLVLTVFALAGLLAYDHRRR